MRTVIIVNQNRRLRAALCELLAQHGMQVLAAADSAEAMEQMVVSPADVVVTNHAMPTMSGIDFARTLRERHPGVKTILVTSQASLDEASQAMRSGVFEFLAKPLDPDALLACLNRALEVKAFEDAQRNYRADLEATVHQHTREMRKVFQDVVIALVSAMELRDPYTAGHQRRVAGLAGAIADELGMSWARREALVFAGLLHDVGKLQVPAEILSLPRRLTPTEYALVQQHALASLTILQHVKFPWPIADFVVQHHERLDGSGYPYGLKGDAISLEGRVLAVADTIEAMASHRPYRAALGIDAALEVLREGAGRTYDGAVVAASERALRRHGKIPSVPDLSISQPAH